MKKINQLILITTFISCFSFFSISGQVVIAQSAKNSKSVTTSKISEDYSFIIENADGKQTKIFSADLKKLARQTVKVNDHGKAATFEGYAIVEVLTLSGIKFGDKIKGKELAKFLLVKAADNYQVVFAIAELEPTFTNKIIIIADKRDGQPLSKTEGPLRLIATEEKKAGRWVRQVIHLKIVSAYTENK